MVTFIIDAPLLLIAGWVLVCVIVHHVAPMPDPYAPEFADEADQAVALTLPQRTPVIPQCIGAEPLTAAALACWERNTEELDDEERQRLNEAFTAAVRLFHGPVPYIPGPYDIAAEGEEQ